MRMKAVLAILDEPVASASDSKKMNHPVFMQMTDDNTACARLVARIRPVQNRKDRPVTLDPLQMPPVF